MTTSTPEPAVCIPSYIGDVWVEVDLDAIAHNVRQTRQLIDEQTRLAAVVKADAYGHGAVQVAKEAVRNGATDLAVTTVAEAIQLRGAGLQVPILVMGSVSPQQAGVVVDHQLCPIVFREETARALAQAGREAGCDVEAHLKLDTGLSRYGVDHPEAVQFMQKVGQLEGLRWVGVCTHLSRVSAAGDIKVKKQSERFLRAVDRLARAGFDFDLQHIARSGAVVDFSHLQLDMVRVGSLLYGMEVLPEHPRSPDVKQALKLFAKVTMVRDLQRGQTAGYGAQFVAPRPMRVAVVPTGFTDGWGLELRSSALTWSTLLKEMGRKLLEKIGLAGRLFRTANGSVQIGQQICPVLGKYGMQQVIVDVTEVEEVDIGTVAYLHCRPTILSGAIPRLYVKDGSLHQVLDSRPADAWHEAAVTCGE